MEISIGAVAQGATAPVTVSANTGLIPESLSQAETQEILPSPVMVSTFGSPDNTLVNTHNQESQSFSPYQQPVETKQTVDLTQHNNEVQSSVGGI